MKQLYLNRQFTRVSMRTAEIAFYHGGIIYPTSPDREPDNSVNGWPIKKNTDGVTEFLSDAINKWKAENKQRTCHLYMNTDDTKVYTSQFLFDKVVCRVDTSRGAPMGRFNCGAPTRYGDAIANWAAVGAKMSVYERIVPLTDGYDAGGAYWGIGTPLYVRYSADLNHVEFFRRQYYRVFDSRLKIYRERGYNAMSLRSLADAFDGNFTTGPKCKDWKPKNMWDMIRMITDSMTIESSSYKFPDYETA